jgi:hypothetical protein
LENGDQANNQTNLDITKQDVDLKESPNTFVPKEVEEIPEKSKNASESSKPSVSQEMIIGAVFGVIGVSMIVGLVAYRFRNTKESDSDNKVFLSKAWKRRSTLGNVFTDNTLTSDVDFDNYNDDAESIVSVQPRVLKDLTKYTL